MMNIPINSHSIHLWGVDLSHSMTREADYFLLLSQDEKERARRFKFDIHRQRFIGGRALLRQILSQYTGILPESICFHYGNHGKPYLYENPLKIQFNISHSHNMAVIAITKEYEIGVDIEKIENQFKTSVAKRFFSQNEYEDLIQLPQDKKIIAFYKIWSKKEAVIKALGKGIFIPLETFTVSSQHNQEIISVMDTQYHVENFFIHEQYQAAFATNQMVNDIQFFWTDEKK